MQMQHFTACLVVSALAIALLYAYESGWRFGIRWLLLVLTAAAIFLAILTSGVLSPPN
jgi:ABC-type multidrug transport system permease subunit